MFQNLELDGVKIHNILFDIRQKGVRKPVTQLHNTCIVYSSSKCRSLSCTLAGSLVGSMLGSDFKGYLIYPVMTICPGKWSLSRPQFEYAPGACISRKSSTYHSWRLNPMENFTEREVRVLQKQRAVMKKVLEDPNFTQLSKEVREAVRRSLAASAEILI